MQTLVRSGHLDEQWILDVEEAMMMNNLHLTSEISGDFTTMFCSQLVHVCEMFFLHHFLCSTVKVECFTY